MKTVLGLSVTAAGVGWVLVDGTTPVDDDQFAVRGLDDLVPRCLAAVRGAQSIAASSGRRIDSIGVCWSQDVEDQVSTLLGELRAAGCPDVRSVRQVTPPERAVPPAERTERPDLRGLLAGVLAEDADTDADDVTAFVELDVICAPDAGQTSAYDAAQAVVTNAAPAEPVQSVRARRTWMPDTWTPALSGARLVSAAAVTAVIALFAVGSQFVGTGNERPAEAALAGSASAPTAQTTQVVPRQPPAAQPPAAQAMAAVPEPTPTVAEVSEPPVQLALPQPQPVDEPSVPVEPPVSAEPLAASHLPVPDAVPAPVAAPEQPAPAAAPVAPPEVLPPAPVPPPPFWLMPPFVPAPPPPPPAVVAPAPEALAAPVEHLPPPAPVPPAPPVNPVFGALP